MRQALSRFQAACRVTFGERTRLAALPGNILLSGVPQAPLGLIRCLAGGAVAASLATEVFPKAFKEDSYTTGFATALGLVLAVALDQLG